MNLYYSVSFDSPYGLQYIKKCVTIHPGSFTTKYELTKLVYYEGFHRIEEAISREKQIIPNR